MFTSDCLKAAPAIFFDKLAYLFRLFLFHGHVSSQLLACALCPILKDPNGDIASSKNYRGIALSSLILKVLDNCILLLFGHLLANDVLQFGFQKGLSTVQCTWVVQETISQYLRNGSEVYCCLLDFSKAFDKVNFEKLFSCLIEREIQAVILRILLVIYQNQSCFIQWNGHKSTGFKVKNGVRQGAILSPFLFCIYLDSLLAELRDVGVGCYVGGKFIGALGYADDVTLLSPSRQGLQIMLTVCEQWAKKHSMQFSTDPIPSKSKSKCLFFSRNRSVNKVENLVLNGNKLPWVSSAKHLGNHLSTKIDFSFAIPDMSSDLRSKRGIFFNKVHELIQQFGQLDPKLIVKLLSVYGTSLYGSSLWKLNSEDFNKLCRSWNTAMKIIWNLPHNTHTRLLESLSPVSHLKSVLAGRYIGFVQSLSATSNSILGFLFTLCKKNVSTLTGHNIRHLMDENNLLEFNDMIRMRSSIKTSRINALEEEEKWKVDLINDIALAKRGILSIDNLEEDELGHILQFACTC